jgi:hypothetical protein
MVDIEFKGYKFNILNEISFGNLLAAPHMYSQRFQVTQSPTENQSANQVKDTASIQGLLNIINPANSTNNITTEIVSERGYQKVAEIYSEYKAKGLVSPDFPELTVQQLMNKLENFEQAIVNSYKKSNVEPLTNIRNYKQKLTDYFANVRESNSSWFNTYCNVKPIVLHGGQLVYAFKENLDLTAKQEAMSKLSDLVARYNLALAENPTLGTTKGTSPIKNPIKFDDFFKDVNYDDINFEETVRYQTGILLPTIEDKERIKATIEKQSAPNSEVTFVLGVAVPKKIIFPKFIIFEGNNMFDKNKASALNIKIGNGGS